MEFLTWPVERITDRDAALPHCVVTRRPFDAGGRLDLATALLLPSAGVEAQDLPANALPAGPMAQDACLGLWMGSCFPIRAGDAAARVGWVSNFPPTTMYQDEFSDSLDEVQLGARQEYAQLARLKAQGCNVLLAINPVQTVTEAALSGADALLIVLRSAFDIQKLSDGGLAQVRAALGPTRPIVIHGGAESHLPRAPAELGVDAILHLPG
ncbi:MAG: hypothetical protein AAF092_03485 [Pseudomonadota bacterium]